MFRSRRAALGAMLLLASLSQNVPPAQAQASSPSASSSSSEALIARLKDKDPAVVADAMRTLGTRGELKAYRPILDALSKATDAEVRSTGLAALEKLPYTPSFLTGVLRDSTQTSLARSHAIYMLGRMRAQEAVPDIITALNDKDETVRERAIEALERIRDPRALKPLIIAAHKDPSPILRGKAQKAAETLSGSGIDRGKDPEALALQLKDPSVVKRREAAQALSQTGTWWSIQPLIEALKDPDAEVQRYAARALGDLQDRRAVAPLLAYLPGSAGLSRQTAIMAIGVLKDDAAVEGLLPYLQDPDQTTRRMTARALAVIGSPRAGAGLLKASTDLVAENRREVIRALGVVHYAPSIPRLTVIVRDDIEENQIEAVRAIGRMGTRDALPYLYRILDDKNPMVAATAVSAIKELGYAEAVPSLEQLARHTKDNYLKEEALEAAVELKGKTNRSPEKPAGQP